MAPNLPDLSPYEGSYAERLMRWRNDPNRKFIAEAGSEYSIRANREADVTIWGVVH